MAILYLAIACVAILEVGHQISLSAIDAIDRRRRRRLNPG